MLRLQARTHGEAFAAEVTAVRADVVAFVTRLIAEAAREALRAPGRVPAEGTAKDARLSEAEAAGLAEALAGAAESLAGWANATPHVTARQAAATVMNCAWAGLGELLAGRPWSPPGA
ncbi:hypothetical protein GCM10020295_33770 [Streptomyces cinereospinus]